MHDSDSDEEGGEQGRGERGPGPGGLGERGGGAEPAAAGWGVGAQAAGGGDVAAVTPAVAATAVGQAQRPWGASHEGLLLQGGAGPAAATATTPHLARAGTGAGAAFGEGNLTHPQQQRQQQQQQAPPPAGGGGVTPAQAAVAAEAGAEGSTVDVLRSRRTMQSRFLSAALTHPTPPRAPLLGDPGAHALTPSGAAGALPQAPSQQGHDLLRQALAGGSAHEEPPQAADPAWWWGTVGPQHYTGGGRRGHKGGGRGGGLDGMLQAAQAALALRRKQLLAAAATATQQEAGAGTQAPAGALVCEVEDEGVLEGHLRKVLVRCVGGGGGVAGEGGSESRAWLLLPASGLLPLPGGGSVSLDMTTGSRWVDGVCRGCVGAEGWPQQAPKACAAGVLRAQAAGAPAVEARGVRRRRRRRGIIVVFCTPACAAGLLRVARMMVQHFVVQNGWARGGGERRVAPAESRSTLFGVVHQRALRRGEQLALAASGCPSTADSLTPAQSIPPGSQARTEQRGVLMRSIPRKTAASVWGSRRASSKRPRVDERTALQPHGKQHAIRCPISSCVVRRCAALPRGDARGRQRPGRAVQSQLAREASGAAALPMRSQMPGCLMCAGTSWRPGASIGQHRLDAP